MAADLLIVDTERASSLGLCDFRVFVTLWDERLERQHEVWLTVSDEDGELVVDGHGAPGPVSVAVEACGEWAIERFLRAEREAA